MPSPLRALAVPIVLLSVVACSQDDDRSDASTGASTAPVTTSAPDAAVPAAALFDVSTVHDIDVEFDPDDYDEMIAAYRDSGDKDWIEADVTIDGTTIEGAGLRLKGNSSLFGLGGTTPGGPGADAGQGAGVGGADADQPERLPWLVRFDEFVDGQDLDGLTELVIRSNNTETALNEAVALELLGQAGLATQRSTHVRLTVNGSDAVLRLVIENPDDEWDGRTFEDAGILYKAESGGDYSYRGEDPEAYDEVFDQETRTDEPDVGPLIDFLAFINDADDRTFRQELGEHLDINAFAHYLAFEDLVDNFDAIDGPGNNSYLRWDEVTEQFTVVAWDHNLTFGGGGGDTGFPVPPGGAGGLPDGFEPPEGLDLPGGIEASLGGNVLAERFRADPSLAQLIDEATADLERRLVGSGAATDALVVRSEVLLAEATDLVPARTIRRETRAIARYFQDDGD